MVSRPPRHGDGLAIMGFGGGAFIGSNLSLALMDYFKSATDTGVAPTFLCMGRSTWLRSALFGALIVRVPAADWKPAGYDAPRPRAAERDDHDASGRAGTGVADAAVLVPVGRAVLQRDGGHRHPGTSVADDPGDVQGQGSTRWRRRSGFVAFLSLFNMAGRFLWSIDERLTSAARRFTPSILLLGAAAVLPDSLRGPHRQHVLFVAVTAVIISMYGGGFATVPAYLKDLFGTMNVGAIHGRLLTAWSVAGILGPLLVNGIRDHQDQGRLTRAWTFMRQTMYLMAGLLIIGLVCNLANSARGRPVSFPRKRRPCPLIDNLPVFMAEQDSTPSAAGSSALQLILYWAVVGRAARVGGLQDGAEAAGAVPLICRGGRSACRVLAQCLRFVFRPTDGGTLPAIKRQAERPPYNFAGSFQFVNNASSPAAIS